MKRLVIATLLLVVGIAGGGATGHSVAYAANGGNSDAAHACQHGGYAHLIGTNGTTITTFSNTGECVSYAAHGGKLVQRSRVAQCLNGGFATLFPATGTAPFASEAACVGYILGGGTTYAYPVFLLTTPTILQSSANQCYRGFTSSLPVSGPLYDTHTSMYPGSILCFQSDGNLVIYSNGTAVWNSGTSGHPGAYLALQTDGNFVIYSATGTALFNTQTNGHPGDCVVFQGDGNLVVYTSCA